MEHLPGHHSQGSLDETNNQEDEPITSTNSRSAGEHEHFTDDESPIRSENRLFQTEDDQEQIVQTDQDISKDA